MKINKCPKCGREPSVTRFRAVENFNSIPKIGSEIECYYCGLHTGRCKTHAEAVTKWNELTEVKK